MAQTAVEIQWLSSILTELNVPLLSLIVVIWYDNYGAGVLASNPVFHERTKHIEIDIYFICDLVASKLIEVRYIPIEGQLVDLLTKPLPESRFTLICSRLCLRDGRPIQGGL